MRTAKQTESYRIVSYRAISMPFFFFLQNQNPSVGRPFARNCQSRIGISIRHDCRRQHQARKKSRASCVQLALWRETELTTSIIRTRTLRTVGTYEISVQRYEAPTTGKLCSVRRAFADRRPKKNSKFWIIYDFTRFGVFRWRRLFPNQSVGTKHTSLVTKDISSCILLVVYGHFANQETSEFSNQSIKTSFHKFFAN